MAQWVHQKSETCHSHAGFLTALQIWIKKPHVLNKRLCGASVKFIASVDCSSSEAVRELAIRNLNIIQSRLLNDMILHDLSFTKFHNLLSQLFCKQDLKVTCDSETDFIDNEGALLQGLKFVLRTLLPKNTAKYSELMELVIYGILLIY